MLPTVQSSSITIVKAPVLCNNFCVENRTRGFRPVKDGFQKRRKYEKKNLSLMKIQDFLIRNQLKYVNYRNIRTIQLFFKLFLFHNIPKFEKVSLNKVIRHILQITF